jgi:hypothetical protein
MRRSVRDESQHGVVRQNRSGEMRISDLFITSALLAAPAVPVLAQDQGPPISAVFSLISRGDAVTAPQLTSAVRRLNAYANSFNSNPCRGRLQQATFAGTLSGTYQVVIDCPSMDAFNRSQQVLNADPKFRQLFGDVQTKLDAAGGTLLSQSLYQEVR